MAYQSFFSHFNLHNYHPCCVKISPQFGNLLGDFSEIRDSGGSKKTRQLSQTFEYHWHINRFFPLVNLHNYHLRCAKMLPQLANFYWFLYVFVWRETVESNSYVIHSLKLSCSSVYSLRCNVLLPIEFLINNSMAIWVDELLIISLISGMVSYWLSRKCNFANELCLFYVGCEALLSGFGSMQLIAGSTGKPKFLAPSKRNFLRIASYDGELNQQFCYLQCRLAESMYFVPRRKWVGWSCKLQDQNLPLTIPFIVRVLGKQQFRPYFESSNCDKSSLLTWLRW